jgi:hypothetical protein
MDTNRYESARKRAPGKNPVVLGAFATAWLYWIGVAGAAALFIGAMVWLLLQPAVLQPTALQPAATITNRAPELEPAAAVSTLPPARSRE